MPSYSLESLASKLKIKFRGSGTLMLSGLCDVTRLKEGSILFVEDPKKGFPSNHDLFLIAEEFVDLFPRTASLLMAEHVRSSFNHLLKLFDPYQPVAHQKALSTFPEDVKVGSNVTIGKNVIIETNVEIGDESILIGNIYLGSHVKLGTKVVLHPGVVIEAGCEVGDRTIIHANTVIGSDGFGYTQEGGRNVKVHQIGVVKIGHDCEIGSNVSIDRATLGETKIGNNVVIDNLVQIAHNVCVDDYAIIAGQAGIGGSAKIGRRAILAGQAGIADHAIIGEGAVITAQAGVMSRQEVLPGVLLAGSPAIPLREHYKVAAYSRRLPELFKELKKSKEDLKD